MGNSQSEDARSNCYNFETSQISATQIPRHDLPDVIAKPQRKSAFLEVGLGRDDALVSEKMKRESVCSQTSLKHHMRRTDKAETRLTANSSARSRQSFTNRSTLFRALMVLGAAVAILSLFSALNISVPLASHVVEAGEIETVMLRSKLSSRPLLERQDNSVDVCKRWAHMSAIVNGTLYIYGGEATTNPDQTNDTWNNNFLSLDLTKTWQIGSPSLTSEARPSELPAISLGTVWNDMNNLYLYGGEFSWKPPESPLPNALWQYSISSKAWTQHSKPTDVNGQAVERAAEGAGISVPYLGRGLYLGGHLDGYTTEGWSQSVPRVYLQSTLEYTMPGSVNSAIASSPAGSDGAYRNLTVSSAGFPQRADGVLVYVPGYGDSGIIIALAGGTVDTFTQMNVIDVFDIAGSKWYRQATSGPSPLIRVNPCAVALSASDGSSTQIYMYGGQNLQPAENQTQYDDLWILTIPSFTWLEVDQSQQSTPPARAGHTCNVWNSQMVVVGGYVGQELSCDSPGIYVFNTSSLSWQNQYNAPDNGDPLNRQISQQGDVSALQGSYDYQVPALVQSQIGGNAEGSATVTTPVQFPTAGPLASGKPHTYTQTGTGTAGPTSTTRPSGGSGSGASGHGSSGGVNTGAIVAGVIAGVLALLAGYLGFCAWVYRRQLKLYKNHVAMVQRESLAADPAHNALGIGAVGVTSKKYSDKDQSSDGKPWSLDNRSGRSLEGTTPGSGDRPSFINGNRRQELNSNNPYRNVPGGAGYATASSSTDDLLQGQEPSFLGVVLNPRRSLRVVNKD